MTAPIRLGAPMMVIAIDGPAGSGKSTVARSLAGRLSLAHLDTGAMYRAVAHAVLAGGVDPDDGDAVTRVAEQARLEFENHRVVVDGVDATRVIRGPEVTGAVSAVAANPGVRAALLTRQRSWADEHDGGVVEGRDIGTVVFPDATLKLYLTARAEVRAQRRARELPDAQVATVAADLARRDCADSSRRLSPLSVADDAHTIDTSDQGVDEIVAQIVALLR